MICHDKPGIMDYLEEDHRGKVPFSHIISRVQTINMVYDC